MDDDSGVFDRREYEFFALDGTAVSRARFDAMYPEGSVVVKQTDILGFGVSTEFVGINHNDDPLGPPWIFETIAMQDSSADVVFERWASSEHEAHVNHTNAVWRTMLGWWFVWRLTHAAKRVRFSVRKFLRAL